MRLYILMRSDMASLNPGKAMAQAAHAANLFQSSLTPTANKLNGFKQWFKEGKGFGTTIVLDVGDAQKLRNRINEAIETCHMAGEVLDETYPIRDGKVTHLIPVVTCGYIFWPHDEKPGFLSDLPLYA